MKREHLSAVFLLVPDSFPKIIPFKAKLSHHFFDYMLFSQHPAICDSGDKKSVCKAPLTHKPANSVGRMNTVKSVFGPQCASSKDGFVLSDLLSKLLEIHFEKLPLNLFNPKSKSSHLAPIKGRGVGPVALKSSVLLSVCEVMSCSENCAA